MQILGVLVGFLFFFLYHVGMRTILLDVAPKDPQLLAHFSLDDRIEELKKLVSTYKWVVILQTLQKRDSPDYKTYIWSGKLEEIITSAQELKADTIIIWNILKPRQIYAIIKEIEKRKLKIQIWDRVDLILKIFQMHAKTPESKLQIQLASIKHMWPRIFGMWMELDRQWWWWGASNKWIGETNTEIMSRHLRVMERKIRDRIDHYRKVRTQNRVFRTRSQALTVGIVWYTNAGKSTLMNALTDKWVYEKDELFATLWTTVGRLKLSESEFYNSEGKYTARKDILIYDTIGFIRDLPPELIDAFSSTLEESVSCDLLLQVVDARDPHIMEKLSVTDDILQHIWAHQTRWYIFNQIDGCDTDRLSFLREKYAHLFPIFISAKTLEWIEELKNKLIQFQQ